MPPSKNSPCQLLVEGTDDKFTIINLLKQHGVDWDDESKPCPHIKPCGGKPSLLDAILPITKLRGLTNLSIVLDANGNIQDCWRSIRGSFSKVDLDLPEKHNNEGTVVNAVISERSVTIGVWIMPDNEANGALEDFVNLMLPDKDCLLEYAENASIEAKKHGATFSDKDLPKARLHAWLAWQRTPGVPYGQAINNRILRSDNECALRFVKWFGQVFPGLVNTTS